MNKIEFEVVKINPIKRIFLERIKDWHEEGNHIQKLLHNCDDEYRKKTANTWENDIKISIEKNIEAPSRVYNITCKDSTVKEIEIKRTLSHNIRIPIILKQILLLSFPIAKNVRININNNDKRI